MQGSIGLGTRTRAKDEPFPGLVAALTKLSKWNRKREDDRVRKSAQELEADRVREWTQECNSAGGVPHDDRDWQRRRLRLAAEQGSTVAMRSLKELEKAERQPVIHSGTPVVPSTRRHEKATATKRASTDHTSLRQSKRSSSEISNASTVVVETRDPVKEMATPVVVVGDALPALPAAASSHDGNLSSDNELAELVRMFPDLDREVLEATLEGARTCSFLGSAEQMEIAVDALLTSSAPSGPAAVRSSTSRSRPPTCPARHQ